MTNTPPDNNNNNNNSADKAKNANSAADLLRWEETDGGFRLVTEDGRPWCAPVEIPLAGDATDELVFPFPEDIPEVGVASEAGGCEGYTLRVQGSATPVADSTK